jgi:methylphosphotriester-DNA--protein-cysteine methyltransferase
MFGTPVHAHLSGIRVKIANESLCRPEYSLQTIAKAAGSQDQRAFTQSFSGVVGIAPGSYIRHIAAKGPTREPLSTHTQGGARDEIV